MTQIAIEKQIEAIRVSTASALKSKADAIRYLIDAGILTKEKKKKKKK